MIIYSVFLSFLTWGCTPVLLPAPVERHPGAPTWMLEVWSSRNYSYTKIKTILYISSITLLDVLLQVFILSPFISFSVSLNWPCRLRVSQYNSHPRAPLQARGHWCYQEQYLIVMGTRASGGLPSVLLCYRGLWVCLWPIASSYV